MDDNINQTRQTMTESAPLDAADNGVRRVRHAMKLRTLQVQQVTDLSPLLRRVRFAGGDLHDFVSASFDDHVKLFFPLPGQQEPLLPSGPPGSRSVDGPRPVARDYTPSRFDTAAGTLDIDFLLHGHGPAASWAAQAQPGQRLGLGGPRGSFILPDGLPWQLLIGDDAALPAIARRLTELPAGTPVQVLLETRDAGTQLALPTAAAAQITWLHRGSAAPGSSGLLAAAAGRLPKPDGDGFVWAAGESAEIAAVRQVLVSRWGLPKQQIRAASYWKRGAESHHEVMDS